MIQLGRISMDWLIQQARLEYAKETKKARAVQSQPPKETCRP